jgi:guanosine-3',5'-bis(diphosphate) 3'-pyrophosphohydrolase
MPKMELDRKLLEAVAFAARAHQGQLRKDGRTPYLSHVFRVCLIVRDVFHITDSRALMTAVLHDTVEDTLVDYDELEEKFGAEVAGWVALLSKDKRLPEAERERAYVERLARAPWQVQACKLADIADNLMDVANLPPERRAHSIARARQYLAALKAHVAVEVKQPYEIVSRLVEEVDGK